MRQSYKCNELTISPYTLKYKYNLDSILDNYIHYHYRSNSTDLVAKSENRRSTTRVKGKKKKGRRNKTTLYINLAHSLIYRFLFRRRIFSRLHFFVDVWEKKKEKRKKIEFIFQVCFPRNKIISDRKKKKKKKKTILLLTIHLCIFYQF